MQIELAFIEQILKAEGKAINASTLRAIRKHILFKYGRTGLLENGNTESVSNNTLTLTHPIHKRFLDMKARQRDGQLRKKKYPIHNKIIFGHYNEIAYKLMYGLTEEVAQGIKDNFKE